MSFIKKNILTIIFLLIFSTSYSQSDKVDSLRGNFTYLLKSKPNSLRPDYVYQELFSLQISDRRSFFISENMLKFDSVFRTEAKPYIKEGSSTVIDFRGKTLPKLSSKFIIIQTNDNVQYYSTIGMSLLSYNIAKINNWKLMNEKKIINSLNCKKAEVSFKGRDWIAWYTTEIPFPYGPYKFSGLPGLIVKITDKKGDYDFELVKSIPSNAMKGKIITIDKNRFQNSKWVTKKELDEAKRNFRENISGSMESMGVKFTPEQRENLRQKQKNIEEEKKGYNPLELED